MLSARHPRLRRYLEHRLAIIRQALVHWSHQEKYAALQISRFVNELCDMRDSGAIDQTEVSESCRNGDCHCTDCSTGG
jgi:hypothetical protein